MKITKYPQSCVKIEDNGQTLLVDVGTLTTASYGIDDLGRADAVLFTHTHADHFDVSKLEELAASGAQIYGNANVAQSSNGTPVEVIGDNEELVIAGFKVRAVPMEHCLMVNGRPAGIPNTGFLINDRLLLPGDSVADVGITAEIVALPVFGPDISFKDAYAFAVVTKAKTVIPVHYDIVGLNPTMFEQFSGSGLAAQVVVLENGTPTDF